MPTHVLVRKDEVRWSCEFPHLGEYGVTFICSGTWCFIPWSEVSHLELASGQTLEVWQHTRGMGERAASPRGTL